MSCAIVSLSALLLAAYPEPAHVAPPAPDLAAHLPVRNDVHGDPMPRGAVARLGTVRLRHGAPVNALAYSRDGKLLASASDDGTVAVWDHDSGRPRARFPLGRQARHVAFLPGDAKAGPLLIAAGDCLPAGVWDVVSGKCLRRLGEPEPNGYLLTIALSPDGKTLATGSLYGKLRLWDVATGRCLHEVTDPDSYTFNRLVFTPDGKTLISVSGFGDPRLWDVDGVKERRRLEKQWSTARAAAVSPGGDKLALALDSGIAVFDLASGKRQQLLGRPAEGADQPLAVAFSPDGRHLAAGYCFRGTTVWDAASGKPVERLSGLTFGVRALAFAPDGKTLATAADEHTVRLWDLGTGRELPRGPGHTKEVSCVAIAPDGRRLFSAGPDGTCRLWNVADGRELPLTKEFREHRAYALALAPDGKTLASGNPEGLYLWDASTGKPLRAPAAGEKGCYALAFIPDGTGVMGNVDGTHVGLWDAAGRPVRQWRGSPEARLEALALSPDGRTVACAEVADGLYLRDARTGEGRLSLQDGELVRDVAFSPDGRSVAATDFLGLSARVWEARTGRLRMRRWHHDLVWGLAFAPDGRTLAVTESGGAIRLHDLAAGKARGELRGHLRGAIDLAFTRDGKRLVSCGADTTLLVWDMEAVLPRAGGKPAQLKDAELEALWADLADDDAAKAYRAIWKAAESPQAVAYLKGKLRPIKDLDDAGRQRLAQLIRDLDSKQFAQRQKATTELEKLGELALPALKEAQGAKPSLETRRRLDELVAKFGGKVPDRETLRGLRAVEALEYAATAEAARLLEAVAGGAPGARLTQDARAAIERLKRRGVAP